MNKQLTEQHSVAGYNPDVLTCIANLSSDEVFTPPQLVNQILDLLPAQLWGDKNATFLDPGCKSGVFLREIAKRLDKGLEKKIPNRQKRMNHIFTKQLYGLAITELTVLLARRSVYCEISSSVNGSVSTMHRPLLTDGKSTFVRFNESVDILNKVEGKNEARFQDLVSANDPFGYDVRVEDSYVRVKPDIKQRAFNKGLQIHYWGNQGKSVGYIDRNSVRKGHALVDKLKIFISRSYGERGEFPYLVLGKPFIGKKGTVCTETYVVVGPFKDKDTLRNVMSYMRTKFFRFLVMLKKIRKAPLGKCMNLFRYRISHVLGPTKSFTRSTA